VHDLLELVVAVGRVSARGALQNVLDAAEADALVRNPLLQLNFVVEIGSQCGTDMETKVTNLKYSQYVQIVFFI
jgi:hypothetical protein